jgi:hypothetical protein
MRFSQIYGLPPLLRLSRLRANAVLIDDLMPGLEALWLSNQDMIDFVAQWDHGIRKILG